MFTFTVIEEKSTTDFRLDGWRIVRNDGLLHSKYWTIAEAEKRADQLNRISAQRFAK